MVIDGIEQAIEAAKYEEEADKMLVVIGVDPDKSVVADLASGLDTSAELVQMLEPAEIRPIEFYAVQIGDQTGDQIKFERQMKDQVLHQFRTQHADAFPKKRNARSVGGFVHSNDKMIVAGQILQQHNDRNANRIDAISRLRKQLYGEWNTIFGAKMTEELPGRNIDWAKLPIDADEYRELYVWEYDDQGQRQLLSSVLMSDQELEGFASFMKGLVNEIKPEVALDEVIGGQVKKWLGKTPAGNQSAAEVIESHTGIPVSAMLLQPALQNLRDPIQENADAQVNILNEKLDRLRKMLDTDRPYFSNPANGKNWFWVDTELLP